MADLKLAASTFSYIYTESGLEASLHLRDMGFEAIEMIVFAPHCWPPLLSATERQAYREQFAARGISLSSFCYPLLDNNPNAPDALMRRYTLDRYREHIDLAAEWGCPYVVAIPGPVNSLIDPPYAWLLDWFVEGVKELVAHARGTGVEILIENVPFTFLPTVDDMLKVLDLVGEPSVGVNFDVCNSAFIKEDPAAAIRKLGPRCKNVHISDSGFDVFKHHGLGKPGGIVDPGPVAEALRAIGYEGYTVLEIIANKVLPDSTPDEDFLTSHAILRQHGWADLRKQG
ncbi:MAG: sugar phosphate isomerase/epimerase family protein [Geminicoccaceae bacterium]